MPLRNKNYLQWEIAKHIALLTLISHPRTVPLTHTNPTINFLMIAKHITVAYPERVLKINFHHI